MNCVILLHSATGNTRLVARFAARRLREAGHTCTIHDVGRHPEPPPLHGVDLVGIACPTNYFGQSRVMARALERLPRAEGRDPLAFLLGTCSGEPGAHFVQQAELLDARGYTVLGARYLAFPDSWPPHRAVTRVFDRTAPLGSFLGDHVPPLRMLLSLPYPDLTQPGPRTVARLGRFVDGVARAAAVRNTSGAPTPGELAAERPKVMVALGRRMTIEQVRRTTDLRLDGQRCSRCGTCVSLCPVGNLTRSGDDEVPRLGDGCVGCWACYQHCPEGAISGWHAPAGAGRYPGPSQQLSELFEARWIE